MQSFIKKSKIIIILGVLFAGVSLFLWRQYYHRYSPTLLILPHFIIAPEKIDTIRSQLAQESVSQDPTIIIISPDHFDTYDTNHLSYDQSITNLCIQWYCHQTQWARIAPSSTSFTITNNTIILPDHGVGAHLRFIKKRLPQAKVIPLLLQARSIENLTSLTDTIQKISKQQPTIIISSVDRSHYVPEPWAKLHDSTTRSVISSHDTDRNNRKKLDVDCPSCLWMIDYIAQENNQSPHLLWRDSSAELFWTMGTDNTSRWFVHYLSSDQRKEEKNLNQETLITGITLLAVGDVIYDRWVKKSLPTPNTLAAHFRERYQLHDVRNNPLFTFHRQWAGIDIAIFNLETPLHLTGTPCYPINKPYSFCSDESILSTLSSLWFTAVSLANNHRFDAGTKQYNLTKDIVKDHGMDVVSDDKVLKKTIRWISIALQAYDFTAISKDETRKKACTDIENSTKEWYKPIISVHRWEEYATQPNARQRETAQYLITCGAKAIIWHHPHVVQNIQRINHVPVIYSLWNFLMDQWFSSETSTGMIVGLVIPQSWLIQLFTGLVDAIP